MSKSNLNPNPEDRLVTAKDVKDILGLATVDDVKRIVNEAFQELAIMLRLGFEDINERMVTKVEFNEFKECVYELKEGVYEFKEEMTMFKYEMHEFKAEMYKFKTEMYEFRDNMLEFKSSMIDFKDETEPVLLSLQTDMMEVKRRLVKIEDDTLETKEEIISLRRATIMTLRDHETRICRVESEAP